MCVLQYTILPRSIESIENNCSLPDLHDLANTRLISHSLYSVYLRSGESTRNCMKLLVLPLRTLSSKEVFLYGEALKASADVSPTIPDKIVNKASSTWASWEKADSGWKKKLVTWGNKAISKIDYREHSLKSIMSESSFKRYYPDALTRKVHLSHPKALKQELVASELVKLAREGIPRHRQKFLYSFIAMPFTAPFMLIPVVPNIPFFYVAFRAWSHYRAMEGSKHLKLLLDQDRIAYSPSAKLDEIYSKDGKLDDVQMKRVLQDKLPEMIVEVERANSQLDLKEAAMGPAMVTQADIDMNKSRARTGLHK